MSNIFLTSDLHFGHYNSIPFTNRPWKTVEEMDEGLINNWNSVVSSRDSVYVLGDFSFHRNQNENLSIFNRLNGNKYLIAGNHDSKPIRNLPWGWVKETYGLKYNNIYSWLSHYPHMSWNRSYHGSYSFFGHQHSKGDFWACQNSCDVGVDYWGYKPVHLNTLIERLKQISETAMNRGFYHNFFWRGRDDKLEFFEFPQNKV